MKSIIIYFEDAEFKQLKEKKGNKTWKEFFTKKCKCEDSGVEKNE